eukprot:5663363-Amphidinium_carterae.1
MQRWSVEPKRMLRKLTGSKPPPHSSQASQQGMLHVNTVRAESTTGTVASRSVWGGQSGFRHLIIPVDHMKQLCETLVTNIRHRKSPIETQNL